MQIGGVFLTEARTEKVSQLGSTCILVTEML